jgi:hypothetical protein
MRVATALSVFVSLFGVHGRGDIQSNSAAVVRPRECPVWFENAPALGSGQPRPVATKALMQVTVCRYLHAFRGGAVIHEVPLTSNFVSFGTVRSRRRVQTLAAEFDGLRPYARSEDEGTCGEGGSGGFYVVFTHSGGSRDSVIVRPSGCRSAIAGTEGRTLALPFSLVQTLASIAPPYHAVH